MDKRLAFDTLEYATLLKNNGVPYAEILSASLAAVITQNIYTKNEVDKMIEATFQRFDSKFEATLKEMKEQTHTLDKRLEERTHTLDKHLEERTSILNKQLNEQIHSLEKEMHHSESRIITALGALIVLVGAIASFTHYFAH